MYYKRQKEEIAIENIYSKLKDHGFATFKYGKFLVHIEVGTPDGVSYYSSAIMKNNEEGTECTIFIGEPCLEDMEYGVPLIFHELGHLVNNDMRPELTDTINNARINELYSEQEYLAWIHACKHLDIATVISAIRKLAIFSFHNHVDSPYPSVELIHYAKLLERRSHRTYRDHRSPR